MSDDEFYEQSIKRDKILHIGLFIYSLSKIYMYKYQYGNYPRYQFIYTDTDSNKMSYEMF